MGHRSKSNLLWTSPNQPLSITAAPALPPLLLLSRPDPVGNRYSRRPPTHLHHRHQIGISKYTQISCVSQACCRASFNWQTPNDILHSVSSSSGSDRGMYKPRQRCRKSPWLKPEGFNLLVSHPAPHTPAHYYHTFSSPVSAFLLTANKKCKLHSRSCISGFSI